MRFALFLVLFCWPLGVVAKFKVCSITINSNDEINIFKKHLSTKNFEFIELIPLKQKSQPNNVHWFTQACRKKHICDILVISGHFGGLFFGENHNYILPVKLMEQYSCSNSCSGILSHVKEVFLFGCNTLAKKESDNRSTQQYLNVLLEHHMARDMAETVVAARYLPFGLSFQDQMRLVFSGNSNIYGFTSLSPLGKHIRTPLNNYFKNINKKHGNYATYLKNKTTDTSNLILHKSIGGTITEVKGLLLDSNLDKNVLKFKKMCHLYNKNTHKIKGMQTVKELMNTEGAWAYLAIKHFISTRQPFDKQSLQIFNQIQTQKKLKTKFRTLYFQIDKHLSYVRIQVLNFLYYFSWVSTPFYQKELKTNILKIVHKPTSESYDFAVALIHDEQVDIQKINLNFKDFSADFYQNIWSALILEVLSVQDDKVHIQLMNTCLSRIQKEPVLCYQVLKSLGHLKVTNSLIIDKMESFLNFSDLGLVYYAIYGLTYAGVNRHSVHLNIAQYFNHKNKWIQLQSIRSVGFLKSQNKEVNQKLIDVLQESTDQDIIYESLQSLYNMAPDLKKLKKIILLRKLNKHSYLKIKKLALLF